MWHHSACRLLAISTMPPTTTMTMTTTIMYDYCSRLSKSNLQLCFEEMSPPLRFRLWILEAMCWDRRFLRSEVLSADHKMVDVYNFRAPNRHWAFDLPFDFAHRFHYLLSPIGIESVSFSRQFRLVLWALCVFPSFRRPLVATIDPLAFRGPYFGHSRCLLCPTNANGLLPIVARAFVVHEATIALSHLCLHSMWNSCEPLRISVHRQTHSID